MRRHQQLQLQTQEEDISQKLQSSHPKWSTADAEKKRHCAGAEKKRHCADEIEGQEHQKARRIRKEGAHPKAVI